MPCWWNRWMCLLHTLRRFLLSLDCSYGFCRSNWKLSATFFKVSMILLVCWLDYKLCSILTLKFNCHFRRTGGCLFSAHMHQLTIWYRNSWFCWWGWAGISGGAIAGICVAGAVLLVAAVGLYIFVYRRKKENALLSPLPFEENSAMQGHGNSLMTSLVPIFVSEHASPSYRQIFHVNSFCI